MLGSQCFKYSCQVNKIFLTGKTGLGKTAIIEEVLKRTSLSYGGFQTKAYLKEGKLVGFKIVDLVTKKEEIIALLSETGIIINPEGFERLGVEAIKRGMEEKKLIIMDELGFMELAAPNFQNKVWEALRNDKPVLGVMKMHKNDFLDKIRDGNHVQIICVTENNRERIKDQLQRMLNDH